MRPTALLLCLLTTVASAQQSPPPPDSEFAPYPGPPAPPLVSAPAEPPPITFSPVEEAPPPVTFPTPVESPPAQVAPPTPVATPTPAPTAPPATGPAESAGERAARYSRYSAGSGGSTLILTEILAGIVGGAMLGAAYDVSDTPGTNDAFTGAVTASLTLGAAAAIYQYLIPVGRYEALLASGAATTGFIAGLTLAVDRDLNSRESALLTFAATQAGVASVLLLTSGKGDVSAGDAALVGMTSLYACVFSSLFEYILADNAHRKYDFSPMLLSPAIGMTIGGLLALPLDLKSQQVLEVGGFPLAVGVATLWIGSRIADGPTVARATFIAMGATLVLSSLALAVSEEPLENDSAQASAVQALPVPVVMPAGRHDEALAAGPGLLLRF